MPDPTSADPRQEVDLVRIKSALGRIAGKAADNQIIRDATEMMFELERLRAELDALRAEHQERIVEARNDQLDIERLRMELGQCERELDALRAQVKQLDQANVTLSGQNTELAEASEALVSENRHARVNLAGREQEAVAFWHEREQLKAQVASLLTTLTQDGFPDPAILHADCRAELAALRAELAEWKHGSSHETEEADRLREKVRDLEHDNRGLVETIHEWQEIHGTFAPEPPCKAEVAALRARLVQTEELASRWVDMAQRQVDVPSELYSARAEGTAEALRMCALMLRELIRGLPEAPPAKDHVNACPCWLCRPLHKPLPEAPPVAAGSGK